MAHSHAHRAWDGSYDAKSGRFSPMHFRRLRSVPRWSSCPSMIATWCRQAWPQVSRHVSRALPTDTRSQQLDTTILRWFRMVRTSTSSRLDATLCQAPECPRWLSAHSARNSTFDAAVKVSYICALQNASSSVSLPRKRTRQAFIPSLASSLRQRNLLYSKIHLKKNPHRLKTQCL